MLKSKNRSSRLISKSRSNKSRSSKLRSKSS